MADTVSGVDAPGVEVIALDADLAAGVFDLVASGAAASTALEGTPR
ncbi:MAG: hypothetical protein AB7S55_03405 [Thiomonas sp.]